MRRWFAMLGAVTISGLVALLPVNAVAADSAPLPSQPRATVGEATGAAVPESTAASAAAAMQADVPLAGEPPAPTVDPTPANTPPVETVPVEDAAAGPAFIKGNLIHPGTRRLLSRFDHVGISVGPYIVENDFFIGVAPGMAWYSDSGVALSLHVPIKLLTIEGGSLDFGGMRIRRQDWDEIADIAKVIRFITYGRKESNLYFTINTMRPTTIGHGMIVNKYQGDIDVDRSLTGFELDAYNAYGGFEFQANDITFTNRIVGGMLFVKPLSLFSDSVYAEGLSLGIEAAADFRAPRCVRFSADSDQCVNGAGHRAGADPFTGVSLDNTFVRTDPDTGRFAVDETIVKAIGVSVEAKVYKDERNIDLKVYGTWHRFLNEGGGDGISGGLLARLNAGTEWISAFRIRGEYQTYTDGFLPNYFDSLYEIQKYAYLFRSRDFQITPTKYQAVFGDPANGFPRSEHGRRQGFNVEASWSLFYKKRSAKQIALGFGLQDSDGPDDTNIYVHVEMPFLGIVQVFATYMRNNVDSLNNVITSNVLRTQDAILLSGMRLQILPFLFINAHYSRSFRVVASPGSEYHLGNENIVDRNGKVSPYFKPDRLFENVQTLYAEVEIGWEFDDD